MNELIVRKIDFWQIFLFLMALPTILSLSGVMAAWFHPDSETLRHLSQYVLADALLNTIALVIGVSTLTVIIGVGLAWLTSVFDFPGRNFFSWALILPMAIPGYVMAFAFVGLFEYTGTLQTYWRTVFGGSSGFPNIYSYGGVVAVLSLVLYPYLYLVVRNAFQTQGRRSLEVGQSLGLSTTAGFFRISLPMARPWIVAGLLLVVMETLADFGTVAVFNYDTLTSVIYRSWFDLFSLSAALQVSSVLLLLVLLVIIFERRNRRVQRYAEPRQPISSTRRIALSGYRARLASGVCITVLMAAFIVPVAQLCLWAAAHISEDLTERFWQYTVGSVALAVTAMCFISALALLLAFSSRLHNGVLSQWAVRLATLGYALPGAVLAVAIFAAVAAVDSGLQSLGLPINLLHGGAAVMLLAYSVRFMAVAFSPIESNLLRVTPSIDLAANSVGVAGFKLLRRVHFPIIKGGFFTAMVLVFVDVMKELPITLMTRPLGFNTLAVRVFELSSEGLWQRAALPAVAIVIVGLIPVLLLIRKSEHHDN